MQNREPRFLQSEIYSCRTSIPASFLIHITAILTLWLLPQLHALKFLWGLSLARPKTYYVVPMAKRSVVYTRIAPPG
ncbi:MAG: hypothetical protein ABSD88_19535, partial [Candidatus Korobacteraceae bacterium]